MELLKFQVADEIHRFGLDTPIALVLYNDTFRYVDHIVEGTPANKMPDSLQLISAGLVLHETTLGEFGKTLSKRETFDFAD